MYPWFTAHVNSSPSDPVLKEMSQGQSIHKELDVGIRKGSESEEMTDTIYKSSSDNVE